MDDQPEPTVPTWTLSAAHTGLVSLLSDGALAPLRGFLTAAELRSVRRDGRLPDGTPWRGEVTLAVPDAVARSAGAAGALHLAGEDGTRLATLTLVDRPGDGSAERPGGGSATGPATGGSVAQPATDDPATEPATGGSATERATGGPATNDTTLVGGELEPLALPVPLAFPHLHHTRTDVANLLADADHVTAVQPSVVPDVATLERWRHHVDTTGAHLLVQPLMPELPAEAWAATVRAHQKAVEQLPAGRVVLHLVDLPDDATVADAATLRAVVAANHGATTLLDAAGADPAVAESRGLDVVPPRGHATGPWHPEVREELDRADRAAATGVAVLLTGLSGAGKSTIARALRARLLESGERSVTLLDGDLVRRTLSSGLGFSPEDRERNVRRIGWVAAEIARHGGIAICAPIAPEDRVRRAVRADVETAGGRFVLVHVATSLDVCEQRDVKGLYAQARAGSLRGLTGVDAPYEAPEDAEVVLDTAEVAVDDAVTRILEAVGS